MSIKQKIRTIGLTGLAALVIGSSASCNNKRFFKDATYNSNNVHIAEIGDSRYIRISKEKDPSFDYIEANDHDGDERFDTIQLSGVPKGSQLEKYANLDSLEVVYETVKGQ